VFAEDEVLLGDDDDLQGRGSEGDVSGRFEVKRALTKKATQ
jgi:hypothetical protein